MESSDLAFNFKDNDILIEVIMLLNKSVQSHDIFPCNYDCEICFDDIKGKYGMVLKCGHCYHRNCFLSNVVRFKRSKCSVCELNLSCTVTTPLNLIGMAEEA
jgi:hypothetical protein